MMKLVLTSVVRGSQQGESHGGVYLVDLENQSAEQKIDWNTAAIDWEGRGGDRGLRGIAIDRDTVYIAASDELFAFSPDFVMTGSWRNPYLKHCHEINILNRTLYLASTGFDSILGFDLDAQKFNRAMHVETKGFKFSATPFDPDGDDGPAMQNKLHINSIHCGDNGIHIAGLKSGGLLPLAEGAMKMATELPPGTHNAQPYRDGVLFNDSRADKVCYSSRTEDIAVPVPRYDRQELTHLYSDFSRIARPGFARGLCVVSDTLVAGGSSPSTVSLYDLSKKEQVLSFNLTMDVRNAIHGLELWPFGD